MIRYDKIKIHVGIVDERQNKNGMAMIYLGIHQIPFRVDQMTPNHSHNYSPSPDVLHPSANNNAYLTQ